MKSELIPVDGSAPIPIVKDVTVIGRREFCDVEIRHESLSKRHAVLVRTDGLLMIRDLASTNGTKVNGQRVMWAALLPNDRLTLGRCKYKVYLGSDEAPSPSETHGKGTFVAARPARPSLLNEDTVRTPPRPKPQPQPVAKPEVQVQFPPPTPLGIPIASKFASGSTDPDMDPEVLDEFVIDDEDEAFVIELE